MHGNAPSLPTGQVLREKRQYLEQDSVRGGTCSIHGEWRHLKGMLGGQCTL